MIPEPGIHVVGVRLHWYNASAPEQDGEAIAAAHDGPNEQAGHGACEFTA